MWYPVFTCTRPIARVIIFAPDGQDMDACVHHMHTQYSMLSVTDTVELVPKTVRMMVRLAMVKRNTFFYNYMKLLYCLKLFSAQ